MKLRLSSAFMLPIIYWVLASLYVVTSDIAIVELFDSEATRMLMQTYKGLVFIVFTALLLLVVILKYRHAIKKAYRRDSLTGLLNINVFIENLRATIALRKKSEKIILGYLNIDNFREVNEQVGFEQANAFLKNLALQLSASTLPGSTISRLHGDQFASFAVLDEKVDLEFHTLDIQNTFHECAREHGIEATCSIGIVIYPTDGTNAESLMSSADEALSIAKAKSDSIQFHDKTLSEKASQQRRLLSDLRQAIYDETLNVVYQPKYDLNTLRVSGLEVLLRWYHPTTGFVSPDVFIPLAEKNDLSLAITRLVLSKVSRELSALELIANGIKHIAINVSAAEFNNPEDMKMLMQHIWQSPQLAPFIRIEISETATLSNIKQSTQVIANLQKSGISFSIDDFGTGFTSLAMLKDLTVDEIKIDRSFVAELTTDRRSETIIKAIVGMADSFDINVVAEGIESKEQLETLQKIGCREAQGYFLGRPMPKEQLTTHLNDVIYEPPA